MIATGRAAAVRSRLEASELEALLVVDPINIAYLTGFEGVFDEEWAHVAVVTPDSLVLFTDGRYEEAASRASAGGEWSVRTAEKTLFGSVLLHLASVGIEAAGVEDSLPHSRFRYLAENFEGRLEALDSWVESIRVRKEPEEIVRITEAQKLTDAAFDHVLGVLAAGRTEREVALELEFFMRREGSEGVAFPAIVASGPNAALPHAKVTDRALEHGDFVKMDFGSRIGGYCSDMTRTVVIGAASERQREIYAAVRAANEAGIAAVGAGVAGCDIDAAARSVLKARGLAELFTHGLGHGVGLQVHELPGVGQRSTEPVPAESVITIEPGVYEPAVGGVRIEDLVVVRDEGAQVLTRSTKDLIEV